MRVLGFVLVLVLVLVLVAGSQAAAQVVVRTEERPSRSSVFLDVLDGEWRAALDEADAAARGEDFTRAAQRYQTVIQHAMREGRDKLVETDREGVFESLPVALRRRLAGLPPEGLRAYRELVDALAGALARDAMAAGDIPALEKLVRRLLFSSHGVKAATCLGDLHLERGDLVGALSTYRLAAEVPGARPGLEGRIAAARRRLAAEDLRARPEAAIAGPGGATLTARALFEGRRRDLSLAAEESRDSTGGLSTPPIPIQDGAIVIRPGRAIVARNLRDGDPPLVRTLPPSAMPLGGAAPGPIALGGAATADVAALAIEHSWLLDHDVVGVRRAEHVFDLYAFDLARDDRLLFTTAEPAAFGADAPWLASVEWTGIPVLAPGLVIAGATTRSGEPEVYAAAFEAGPAPHIRWRTFVCARGYVPPEDREDAAPLQPALARAGSILLVDGGVGAVAALDAHRGEILWVLRTEERAPAPERVHIERSHERRITFRPIVAGDTAVFTAGEQLVALDVATGAVRWRPAAEDPARPIGTWRDLVVVAERGAIALVDPRTGKRVSRALPLPGPPSTLNHGAFAVGDLLLVTREGGVVVTLRVSPKGRGFELQPERYSGMDGSGGSADLIDIAVSAAGVLAVHADTLTLLTPAQPEPLEDLGADDALGVARAYGLDPHLTVLFDDLGIEPPDDLGTDEAGEARASPDLIERVGNLVRVRRAIDGRGRASVTVEANRATRSLRVRIDPAPEE